jgi:hypothetical protein
MIPVWPLAWLAQVGLNFKLRHYQGIQRFELLWPELFLEKLLNLLVRQLG